MTERIDHAAEALRIIADGESAVQKLREAHGRGSFDLADDYGKKASGCWAQAQVHATLALVEQQRIANLLALAQFEWKQDSTRIYTAEDAAKSLRIEAAAALGLKP